MTGSALPATASLTDAPKLNRRQLAKAATRARILAAAQTLFRTRTYAEVSIRLIARTAGLSTGSMFASFADKADLWRVAMGCEPPLDGPATRAAPLLVSALRGLIAVRPANWDDDDDPDAVAAWTAADVALRVAEGQGSESGA